MLQTSARLLQMLSLLQSRRFWTGAELAQATGITARSVRRDMDRLRALGYPVHATTGVGGGYELGAGSELPPLPLDDDEAVAVAVGLRAAATGPVKGLEDASLRALVKLEKVLPKRLRRRVRALEAVSVRLGQSHTRIDAGTLSTVANACRDEVLLRFNYRTRGDVESARRVEPYRVVHSDHRWYLLAFDLERADWRTFRLDRLGVEPTAGARFTPRPLPDDDVAAWVSRQVGAIVHRFQARATVHAPASEVAARLPAQVGRIEPIDAARCNLRLGADRLDELAHFLGSLGFDFVVHEPAELIAEVQRLGERWTRAAEQSDGRG